MCALASAPGPQSGASHAAPAAVDSSPGVRAPFWSPLQRLLQALAESWVVDEPLENSQAIIVLAGDSASGGRIRHAVELHRQGRAPLVVLSGPPLRKNLNEADLMERDAQELGLPTGAMRAVRHQGGGTLEEGEVLCRFLDQHGWRRVIVVTSNYHTRRTRRIYRALSRRYGVVARVSAAPDHAFDPGHWWQPRHRLGTLCVELLKTVYAWWELLKLARRFRPA
jgi:uncharacterized SAM-binding protein YcdF (DUF218 family)